ncbi:MAG: twin-arginine translocase TatA/TatE family subunit [Coriobacteriia bacterium]|nr:twin-arginine translocase TatA/TatE family subunit [Coriobacteriia bacterium]
MRLFGLGPAELLIILAIALVLFGPKQIPKLSRMFGKAMKDVRDGLDGKDEEEAAPAAPAKPEASAGSPVASAPVSQIAEEPQSAVS